MSIRYDFGKNWLDFSAKKIDAQRLQEAILSLDELIGRKNMAGKSFLDIGCGSGLFTVAAIQCGASPVIGFDINPKTIDICENNLVRLAAEIKVKSKPHFDIGSVLDANFLSELGSFDIVYAWGSLHHTGEMWESIRNSASLVREQDGMLVLAIYNRHWSSPIWKQVKIIYNLSPTALQRALDHLFSILIYLAVRAKTGQDPCKKERGMDFRCDVVDWLGGYPYEYAYKSEVISFVEPLGFQLLRIVQPRVPTGCNEFVFKSANMLSKSKTKSG